MKTKATTFEIETNTLLCNAEFCESGIFIGIKRNDEDDTEKVCNLYIQNSEELNDLATIINKINSLNLGE